MNVYLFIGVANSYHSRLADSTFESAFLIYDLFLCLSTFFIPSKLSETQLLTTKSVILGKPFVAFEYLSGCPTIHRCQLFVIEEYSQHFLRKYISHFFFS